MTIFEELERQEIAHALEVIVNLCEYYGDSCLNCPLVVKSDFDGDDYCIFDSTKRAMRMRVKELRGK